MNINKYFRYLVLILMLVVDFACYQEIQEKNDNDRLSENENFTTVNKTDCRDSAVRTEMKKEQQFNTESAFAASEPEQQSLDAYRMQSVVETSFIEAGLVDVHDYDSTFVIDLKYATTDNFVKTNVYGSLTKCYLQPEVAQKLKRAHDILKQKHPDFRFKIWDGARPLSVQKLFWELIDKPEHLKRIYLAPPDSTNGSIHNYGCGVDLTLVKTSGEELDMGTEFDHFSFLAYPTKEDELLEKGQLSTLVVHNRRILRSAMLAAGFIPTNSEWWHFSAMSRQKAKNKYKIIK